MLCVKSRSRCCCRLVILKKTNSKQLPNIPTSTAVCAPCTLSVECIFAVRRLVSLKNTISKQLPNMPKEYISRLVMDRRHRSCTIVSKSGTVLGGITYRPFHAQACLNLFCDLSTPGTFLGSLSHHMSVVLVSVQRPSTERSRCRNTIDVHAAKPCA